MMTVEIRDLTFECILGILEFERTKPQRIIVDAVIAYPYSPNVFVNYATVADRIKTVMRQHAFGLIEEALETVSDALKEDFPTIKELTLTISKPDILPDCRVCVTKKSIF